MTSFKRVGNMTSKLWISAQMGVLLLVLSIVLHGDKSAVCGKEQASASMMNDILFKNMSESFSMKELEDAMISLNRTKRQSLNLLQLAQLAGAGGLNPTPVGGQSNVSGAPKSQNPENLLASCQLTNLLLYQIIQQRQSQAATNPFLSLANANLQGLGSNLNLNVASGLPLNAGAAGSLINPFPAINQNLIFPAQTLETYTTTSTFVTKLTTTAVITIPLLFGNKPVPTTITRTKTYDVTTSEVQTLTSTVRPTYVTQAIAATPVVSNPEASASNALNDVDEEASLVSASVVPNKFQGSKAVATEEYEDEEPSVNTRVGSGGNLHSKLTKNNGRGSGGKRRKPARSGQSQKPVAQVSNSRTSNNRDRDYQERDAQVTNRYGSSQQKERDDYYETDYQPYASNGKTNANANAGFSKRKYGNIYEDEVAVDEDPAAAQYPDDYSYYTRRLKRGERYGDEETNDREYLLEPSTDGDFSSNYQKVERCPPIPKAPDAATVTVTKTEIKTVTKFLGQSTLASNINLNSASRAFESNKPARKRSRSRGRSPASAADQSAADSTPIATSERPSRGVTEDARAQILLRSRSRYNSNNNYQQQPNYDYYSRG